MAAPKGGALSREYRGELNGCACVCVCLCGKLLSELDLISARSFANFGQVQSRPGQARTRPGYGASSSPFPLSFSSSVFLCLSLSFCACLVAAILARQPHSFPLLCCCLALHIVSLHFVCLSVPLTISSPFFPLVCALLSSLRLKIYDNIWAKHMLATAALAAIAD